MAKGVGRVPNRPILQLANSPNVQSVEEQIEQIRKVHDQEWNMCATDFWYFAEGYIKTEDEERGSVRNFPTNWKHLIDIHTGLETHHKVVVLKPRRMMVSNYGVARMLWKAFFAGTAHPDISAIFYGGVMSIGETEAKNLMTRIKKMHDRLPEWMKSRNLIEKDNELMKVWPMGGKIQAFPLKEGGPQTFGFTEVLFDEMARQDSVRTVWEGLLPTLGANGRLLAVSTPNGEDNLFYDLWTNKDGKYEGFLRISPDWWDAPEHDEAWFRQACVGFTDTQIARMWLKSFVGMDGGSPVWGDVYNDKVHCVSAKYIQVNSVRPILLGFDLGYHYPALIVEQYNSRNQFVGIAEFIRYDMDLIDFCEEAIVFLNTIYDREKIPEIIFLPPDANLFRRVKSRKGNLTDHKDIKDMFAVNGKCAIRLGSQEVWTKNKGEGSRLKEVRRAFKLRKDGEPGFYFSDQMATFREGCQAGYQYPEKNKNGVIDEQPVGNKFGHIQDAHQMVVTGYNRFFLGKTIDDQGQPLKIQTTAMPKRRLGFGTGM